MCVCVSEPTCPETAAAAACSTAPKTERLVGGGVGSVAADKLETRSPEALGFDPSPALGQNVSRSTNTTVSSLTEAVMIYTFQCVLSFGPQSNELLLLLLRRSSPLLSISELRPY
jgi:hypothetical protein